MAVKTNAKKVAAKKAVKTVPAKKTTAKNAVAKGGAAKKKAAEKGKGGGKDTPAGKKTSAKKKDLGKKSVSAAPKARPVDETDEPFADDADMPAVAIDIDSIVISHVVVEQVVVKLSDVGCCNVAVTVHVALDIRKDRQAASDNR